MTQDWQRVQEEGTGADKSSTGYRKCTRAQRADDTEGETPQAPAMMPKPIVKIAESTEPQGGRSGAGIELKANRL